MQFFRHNQLYDGRERDKLFGNRIIHNDAVLFPRALQRSCGKYQSVWDTNHRNNLRFRKYLAHLCGSQRNFGIQ